MPIDLFELYSPREHFDRPISDYDIDVVELDRVFEGEWGQQFSCYWTCALNGRRINGGLATDYQSGRSRARDSIHQWEWAVWRENNVFDVEQGRWYKRGELPRLE